MSNATKTNKMYSVNEVYTVFAKTANNAPLKLNFSDAKSQPYCGTNDFSVNVKKSAYHVYMSTVNSELVKSIDNSVEILDNTHDTTKQQLRCKLVKFTDFALLKKCIIAVVKSKITSVEPTATETN